MQRANKPTAGDSLTGVVLFFRDDKGFGFIRPDAERGAEVEDVFVHYSAIDGPANGRRTLHKGQVVEFEVRKGPKGPIAHNVKVTKPDAGATSSKGPRRSGEPDWSRACETCGARPVVPETGMCGPCTFGEAETTGGNF